MPVQGKAHVRPPRRKPNKGHGNLRHGNKIQDPVPVAPLRDYFVQGLERGEFSVCEIAERLGWYRGKIKNGHGKGMRQGLDTTRVQRMLGTKGYSAGIKNGKRYDQPPREFLAYESAVLLCRALGMDPCDVRYENGDPAL